MRKLLNLFVSYALAFLAFLMFDNVSVSAFDYASVCSEEVVADGGIHKKCGDNILYLTDDENKSSYFVSTIELYNDAEIIYAGVIDGVDTFYSGGFYYYGIVYDETNIFSSGNDSWSDIILNGVLIYDGAFDDNFFINQSKKEFVVFYKEVGTYLIRQYTGNEIEKVVRIVVVDKKENRIGISVAKYGGSTLLSETMIGNEGDFKFSISGGKYGYGKKVDVKVNECQFKVLFSENLVIENSNFNKCLHYNENNKVSLTVYDVFGKGKTFNYNFNLLSRDVSVKLENSVSSIETSSRRVVIKSYAGKGKSLNEEYNLYYWSKNPNDKLTYQDFMMNYENSDNKGVYSSSKGVILRDAQGSYYLYALAKDDDSTVVVRSEEYILKKKDRVNKIIMKDFAFVASLMVVGILSIVIYLFVRGKDTD